jgi:ADP-heptose:LPS heptosyltransferase
MGDALWAEPVIREFAQQHKSFIVYTKFPELFENFPFTNVQFKKELSIFSRITILMEKKLRIHFLTINLDNAYEKRPDIHFLHAYQIEAGVPLTNEYPKLYLTEKEKRVSPVSGKFVLLHFESLAKKKFRQVFGVDWNQIVAFFNAQGYKVIQIGLAPEKIDKVITLKTSLRELISLCYHASYFIGIDSGPSHIAASLGIPSIVFFGAINPLNRHFPEMFKGIILKKPCEYDNDQKTALKESCVTCYRSTDPGIAVCSLYSTEEIVLKIQQLMKEYAV